MLLKFFMFKTMNLALAIGLILMGPQCFAKAGKRHRLKDPVDALPARTQENWGDLAVLPGDVLDYMNSYLDLRSFESLACTNSTYDAYKRHLRGKRVEGKFFQREFLGSFVTIPAGFLPPDHFGTQIYVESFQALKHPVTRKMWDYFFKGTREYKTWWRGVLKETKRDWVERRNVPATAVRWEGKHFAPAEIQFFIARLNQWAEKNDPSCTYRVLTDIENRYKRRADPTGLNTDEFSTGVTRANVDEYVTSWENSNPDGQGRRAQPVGNKRPNAFGIELGNVWELSSDLYNPLTLEWGRARRGGSWLDFVDGAGSARRDNANPGYAYGNVGFSLVRTCHNEGAI